MDDVMERSRFSGGRGSNLLPAGCLQRSPFVVFQVMMWFLVFTAHAPRQVLSKRNETYVAEYNLSKVPLWDEARYKTQGKCLDFHDSRYSEFFFYWPEDNPMFHHCCIQLDHVYPAGKLDTDPFLPNKLNFMYSKNGQELHYGIYRDLGYFDQCLPFWKCQKTYLKILETDIFVTYCEKTDLTQLYRRRFWSSIVWRYSLLQTMLPWILILEVVVISLALVIFPLTRRLAPANPARWKNLVHSSKIWLFSIWRRLLMDWGHLYLLAVIGNGLIEAMRRLNVYSIESKVFFDYATLYLLLFVILSAASVLQQLAYWIGSASITHREQHRLDGSDNIQRRSLSANSLENGQVHSSRVTFADQDVQAQEEGLTSEAESSTNDEGTHGDEVSILHVDRSASKSRSIKNRRDSLSKTSTFKKLKESLSKGPSIKKIKEDFWYLSKQVFTLDDEYKWQPIAAQFAIWFALWSFLTFVIDDISEASSLFATLLGFIVQAGCLWTGIYATVVLFQRAYYIFKFFMKLWDDTEHSSSETHFLEFQGPYQVHSSAHFRFLRSGIKSQSERRGDV